MAFLGQLTQQKGQAPLGAKENVNSDEHREEEHLVIQHSRKVRALEPAVNCAGQIEHSKVNWTNRRKLIRGQGDFQEKP